MMRYSFPYPVRLRSSLLELQGLRHEPFTNINGETFGKPALNGFWRVDLEVVARDMQSQLALSAFVTAMSAAGAECVVPICTQWRPEDQRGRRIVRGGVAPAYTFDHVGFASDPFDGFTLYRAAAHRDSYIDVTKPRLSQLWPGHFISLGDKLHQVINVSAIDEREDRIRVSVMPNIRGNHAAGDLVIVDQLRLRCRLEKGDQIGLSTDRIKLSNLSFVEAF